MVNESSRQSRLIIFCFILEEHCKEKKSCFICSLSFFFFLVSILEQIQSFKTCLQIFTDALLIYEKLKDPSQGISKQFSNNK